MNKLFKSILITILIVSAVNANDWYFGVEIGSGSGEKVYSHTNNNLELDFDSTFIGFKIGKVTKKLDRTEFLFISKDLKKSNNSTDHINEFKINLALSVYRIAYKEYFIPYFETSIGIANSENYGGQLATHLRLGIVSKPIDNLLVNVAYRLTTNEGEFNSSVTNYIDQHNDLIFGVSFIF